MDRAGEGRWVGSVGHEDVLRLTDLKEVFEDEDRDGGGEEGDVGEVEEGSGEDEEVEKDEQEASASEESNVPKEKTRKRKKDKDVLSGRAKRGRNQVDTEPSFFSGL